jgi:hypothetical protein
MGYEIDVQTVGRPRYRLRKNAGDRGRDHISNELPVRAIEINAESRTWFIVCAIEGQNPATIGRNNGSNQRIVLTFRRVEVVLNCCELISRIFDLEICWRGNIWL